MPPRPASLGVREEAREDAHPRVAATLSATTEEAPFAPLPTCTQACDFASVLKVR